MVRTLSRGVAAAVVGGIAGAVFLILAFGFHPGFVLEMDRDVTRLTSGFYPAERQGDLTFAWTTPRAVLTLPNQNRRSSWQCVLRVRGARPEGIPQPTMYVELDGVRVASRDLTNYFQDVAVAIPGRPTTPGLRLALLSSTSFRPGPGDPRDLGLQVDRIACQPLDRFAMPPSGATATAATAAALFGAAFGLIAASPVAAAGGAVLVAAFQAIPLSYGPAPYHTAYQDAATNLAIAIPVVLATIALIFGLLQRRLTGLALFVVAFAASAAYMKLLALLHPSKLVIDALFHAHRLEWVLGGRYFFTQPIQSGVQFPYAIALYVFAAPWTALTRDHVALLRIVVVAAEALAGSLLYPMVARAWNDRLAAALAVVLFTLAPLSYGVLHYANLTNAFGQSASLAAVAAATIWRFGAHRVAQILGLSGLIALALLSHVSTLMLLSVTLGALTLAYLFVGDRSLRPVGWSIAIATGLAIVFSVAIYYGHFGESYRTLQRIRAEPASAATTPTPPAATTDTAVGTPSDRQGGLPSRISSLLTLSVGALGWPMCLLSVGGVARLVRIGARSRLGLLIMAWGAAFLTFVVVAVLTPVDPRYARYADEFVARAAYATYPADVALAALGAAWGLQGPPAARLATAVLLIASAVLGLREWLAWLN